METKERVNIHQVLWYFTIFSVIGLIIETIYCFITTGVLESRKGLIWGPFCPVYGVGATFLIILLNKFKNNKIKLFIYGGIIGDTIEYIMSYVLESIYSTRFWDYSYTQFHLNGRICLVYTIFWAVLSVVLILYVKPLIDKCINSINFKYRGIVEKTLIIFLTLDVISTIWAISSYKKRAMNIYYKNEIKNDNTIFYKIEKNIFSNEKMVNTFPNIRFLNEKKEEIWIRDII